MIKRLSGEDLCVFFLSGQKLIALKKKCEDGIGIALSFRVGE